MALPELSFGMNEAAASFVRGYCGWHIAPVITETITVRASGSAIVLPTLLMGTVSIAEPDATILDSTTYAVWPWGVVELTTRSCWAHQILTVTMTHGYDQCPDELVSAASSISQTQLTDGATSVRVGQLQTTRPAGTEGSDIPSYVAAVLERYRIRGTP